MSVYNLVIQELAKLQLCNFDKNGARHKYLYDFHYEVIEMCHK